MSEELTPYEWVAGSSPAALEWRQSLIQRWEQGGAKVFQRVFRQAQTQEPGALFRQPATKIVAPAPHVYFDVEQAPTPTGQYFNVPGAVGHRGPKVTQPATRRRVAEMNGDTPKVIMGRFKEIVGDGPVEFDL